MRRYLFLLIILSYAGHTTAQTFTGEAALPKVDSSGFYQICITPDLSVYLNNDFTDLRIYDGQGHEVPFLFQEEAPAHHTQQFKEYELLEKKQEPGCCTSLILHNPDRSAINNISLSIKNAEVTKEATLLGSDDRTHWFALKQYFTLNAIDSKYATSEIKIVDFPLSNYAYYSLRLDDSTSAPLNVLKAGYYTVSTQEGKYTEVPSLKFSSADSTREKKTYVHITFDTLRFVDKLELSITGMSYYLRRGHVYEKNKRRTKKGSDEVFYNLLYDFELKSGRPAIVQLPGIKLSELLISIENEDNPPLKVAAVKAYQLNRYITAWLEKENAYVLKMGNHQLQAPVYDLAFFKDSIPGTIVTLKASAINSIGGKHEAVTSPTFFTSKLIIWIAIILVIVVLGFMSVRLLKEAGVKND